MSQRDVERTLGRLLTDDMSRRRFLVTPDRASWEAGLALSPAELDALAGLPQAGLTALGERLDLRIRRFDLGTDRKRHVDADVP